MCNFGRGHHKEHFCEINLNLDLWFRRFCLKDFLSGALVALMFGGAKPFVKFLEEGIIGNIPVKLFLIWISGSGDIV